MHENSECITLRIFSGMHLGAEISLCSGSYIIGKDVSSDIILRDQSIEARHIKINITQTLTLANDAGNDDKIEVLIQNLDGTVVSNNEVLADNSALENQVLYKLGQVRFAWFRFGDAHEALAKIQEELQNEAKDEASILQNSGFENKTDKNAGTDTDNNIGTNNGNNVGEDEGTLEDKPSLLSKICKRYLPILILILLLFGITIGINENGNEVINNKVLLNAALEENYFPSIVANVVDDEIYIEGILHNNKDFARLSSLVQSMHFPVHFNVEIESDLMENIMQALNGQGLYPTIRMNANKRKMQISMYLKDELVLNGLKAQLVNLFPAIHSYEIDYNVYFENEVRKAVEKQFVPTLKEKFELHFLAGVVKVVGLLTANEIINVKAIFTDAAKKMNITLVTDFVRKELKPKPLKTSAAPTIVYEINHPVQIIGDVQVSATEDKDTREYSAPEIKDEAELIVDMKTPEQALQPNYEFKVTSVNLKPVKYVILSNEQRIFVGGMLPGGYTLLEIGLDVLSLEKEGSVTTYKLKDTEN